MDSLEDELFLGEDELEENAEYDALNDETFGNDVSEDWEQEHEQFSMFEEKLKEISDDTDENIRVVKASPKLKTLEEIENELMNNNAQQNPLSNIINTSFRAGVDGSISGLGVENSKSELRHMTGFQNMLPQEQIQNMYSIQNRFQDSANLMSHLSIVDQRLQENWVDNNRVLPSTTLPDTVIWQGRPQVHHSNQESINSPVNVLLQNDKTMVWHENNHIPGLNNIPPIKILQKNDFTIWSNSQAHLISNTPQNILPRDINIPHHILQRETNVPQNVLQKEQGVPHRILQRDGFVPVLQTPLPGQSSDPDEFIFNHSDEDEEMDPYAGLMNLRERRWLANVQVMQLEGDDPEYDFYFTEYQKRHGLHRNNDKHNNHGNQNNSESPKMAYIPLQFENSLGKVQVGSVAAPRKVIDKDLVVPETSAPGGSKAKSRKKLKHVLLELERMYAALQVHEINISKTSSENKLPPKRIAAPLPLDLGETSKNMGAYDLPSDPIKLMDNFLRDKDHFITFMSIHKGKVLAYRLLRHCPDERFWLMFFEDVQLILTRDSDDEVLLTFLPIFRSWLLNQGNWNLLCYFTSRLTDLLDLALTNKFGISVISNIIVKAEALNNQMKPIREDQCKIHSKFLETLVDKTFEHKTELETPVTRIDPNMLEPHLQRHLSLDSRKAMDVAKRNVMLTAFGLPTYQKKNKR